MTRTLDLVQVTGGVLAAVERLVSNDLVAIVLVGPSGDVESEAHHAGFGYELDDERLAPVGIGSLSIVQRLAVDPGPIVIDDPECAVGPARSVLGAVGPCPGWGDHRAQHARPWQHVHRVPALRSDQRRVDAGWPEREHIEVAVAVPGRASGRRR